MSQPHESHLGASTSTKTGPSGLAEATGVGQLALQDGVTGVPVFGKHSVTVAVRTSRVQIS